MPALEHALSSWESFYVIVGSSGGALIGLQFVVVTLVNNMRTRPTSDTIGAFSTPTVVHLSGALIVSALMSAPWSSLRYVSLMLALCGLGGLVYGVVVILRARRQTDYVPIWQDWLWYAMLPSLIYGMLASSPIVAGTNEEAALFLIAAAALGLLVVGIHNAWDSVTHIAVTGMQSDNAAGS
jgi:hypothetical protein